MLAVLDITSVAIHSLQKFPPKLHVPVMSLIRAKGITTVATRRSAMAMDTKNKWDSLRRLRSVAMATQTKMFPRIAEAI